MKKLDKFGSNVYRGLPTRNPILDAKGFYIEFLTRISIMFIFIYWVVFGGKFYGIF